MRYTRDESVVAAEALAFWREDGEARRAQARVLRPTFVCVWKADVVGTSHSLAGAPHTFVGFGNYREMSRLASRLPSQTYILDRIYWSAILDVRGEPTVVSVSPYTTSDGERR